MSKIQTSLQTYKRQRIQQKLWRQCQLLPVDVVAYNNFASNDYLGLRFHPAVIQSYQQALSIWGAGSSGSPLITGYQQPHHRLNEYIADWLGYEQVMLFSSGFAANQGTLQALKKIELLPILDKLSHASLYDGAGERPVRFHHNNIEHLKKIMHKQSNKAQVIVVESCYSMDGDTAPIADLCQIKKQAQEQGHQDTYLYVDDAHGIGIGTEGKGSVPDQLRKEVDFYVATFGKALGSQGACVAASTDWIEYFIQSNREFIYSTAMPAAQAVAIYTAIKLVRTEPSLQEQHSELIAHFKEEIKAHALPFITSNTAIQPLWVGESEEAVRLSQFLYERGFICSAIRPPTVPPGQARLRFTVTLHQTKASISMLFRTLASYYQLRQMEN